MISRLLDEPYWDELQERVRDIALKLPGINQNSFFRFAAFILLNNPLTIKDNRNTSEKSQVIDHLEKNLNSLRKEMLRLVLLDVFEYSSENDIYQYKFNKAINSYQDIEKIYQIGLKVIQAKRQGNLKEIILEVIGKND